jgi:hypothetical protein
VAKGARLFRCEAADRQVGANRTACRLFVSVKFSINVITKCEIAVWRQSPALVGAERVECQPPSPALHPYTAAAPRFPSEELLAKLTLTTWRRFLCSSARTVDISSRTRSSAPPPCAIPTSATSAGPHGKMFGRAAVTTSAPAAALISAHRTRSSWRPAPASTCCLKQLASLAARDVQQAAGHSEG